jgi:hypothetical protein
MTTNTPNEKRPETIDERDSVVPRSPARSRVTKARTGVLAAMVVAVVAVAACGSSSSASSTTPSTTTPASTAPSSTAGSGAPAGGGATNARSGPATGGAAGTVNTVSASTFTMTTSAGQKVTVNEASSTTYANGTSSVSASAITTGKDVLVLGTTSGTTITAAQVIVQPAGGSATSGASPVVPFKRGAASTSKQDGQIPANYTQGSGTIVSGTTANKATEAALVAYPGGVVDRVVQLSNGEYEVHYIGVNWPHHVFVNTDFKVVGAF